MNETAALKDLSPGMTLLFFAPFCFLLVAIAVLPLVSGVSSWWKKDSSKITVSLLAAAGGILLYVLKTHDFSKVYEVFLEYGAFIALLSALFVVSGGIHITGAFAGFPFMNTLFLFVGAIFSNYLGTTGASLLLVRPLLRANRHRKHKTHLFIFFIFIVSNCGGLLTPLGDPPLYLGFLHGVPFLWTFRLLPQWIFVMVILLFIFHLLDEYYFHKEELSAKQYLAAQITSARKVVHVEGTLNLFLLAFIIGLVLFSGYVLNPWLEKNWKPEDAHTACNVFQILFLSSITLISYKWTSLKIHVENNVHFAPIQEVAILFFGVFGTLIPVLAFLEAKAASLNLSEPWQYFWASGLLSGFLDSAPAYLSFATLGAGRNGLSPHQLGALAEHFPRLLQAVSCGTVLFGALTYIGNGPNFMVKAIAEHYGVKMPSFGRYLLWALVVLVPIFLLVTFIFF